MSKKSYGRVMIDIAGTALTDDDINIIEDKHVGGIILFDRNFSSRQQLELLCFQIRSVKDEILIAVDQEGGRVQRFRKGFTSLPPLQILGNYVATDVEIGRGVCENIGWLMASEVIASGLDISFSPVLDLDRETSSVIGNRSFSDQLHLTIEAAKPFIEGMRQAGMASTGKHFPGHGGISSDSHLEIAIDKRRLEELMDHDIKPYIELKNDLAGIMSCHIIYPNIDKKRASFSSFWLKDILRKKLQFNGVIFSDDLSMAGAYEEGSYSVKSRLALEAGSDMILICNNHQGVRETLSFLKSNNVELSDKISIMRANKSISWSSLENHPRREAALQDLKKLPSF